MNIPYGPTTVVREIVSGSTEVASATFYSPDADAEFLLFAKIIGGGGWSITLNWTDEENNGQSASSSGGFVPLSLAWVKGSSNMTYAITGGTGSYVATIVAVKLSQ